MSSYRGGVEIGGQVGFKKGWRIGRGMEGRGARSTEEGDLKKTACLQEGRRCGEGGGQGRPEHEGGGLEEEGRGARSTEEGDLKKIPSYRRV